MEKKKSMVVYFDILDKTHRLTDEQFGKLMRAVITYSAQGCENYPEFEDSIIAIAFDSLAPNCKDNLEKWEEIRQKRSEAGKKGGAPKGNQNANKTSKTSKNNQNQAKQPVNVNVNVNDTVSVKENIKKEESVKGKGYIDEEEEWGYIENNTHESAPLTLAPISSEVEDKVLKQIKEKVGTRDMVKYDYRFISQDTGIEEGIVKRVTEELIKKGLIKCAMIEVQSKSNGKFYPTPHWSLVSKSLTNGVIKVKVPTQAQTLGVKYGDSVYSQLYIQASQYEWNYKEGWEIGDFIEGNWDIITKITNTLRTGSTWYEEKVQKYWDNYDEKFYTALLYAIKQFSLPAKQVV